MFLLRKLKTGKVLMGVFCVLGLLDCVPTQAQFVLPKKKLNTAEPLSAKERWSFRTNAFGWLTLTPNASIEYSLSADPYNKFTLVGSGRVSWGSKPDVLSYHQYQIAGGSLELRKYWHTRGRDRQNKYANVADEMFSAERYDARTWRGYYIGLYGGYDNVNFKLSREGYRGGVSQFGLSYGMVRPLYNYKQSVLDIEFGINVGAAYLNGHKYILDRDANQYVNTTEKKGFVKYPVVSNISVSLVYRYGTSIKNRARYDQAKHLAKEEQKAQRRKIREAQRDEYLKEVEAKKAAKEEAKAAKKAADEEYKAGQQAQSEQDAAKQATVEEMNKQAKAQAKAEKKAAAAAAKAAKKAAKNN